MPDASKVARAKQLLAQYGAWIHKYRGGLPAGAMAAYMLHESNGNPNAPGDASLGEAGLYQITKSIPPKFGYAPEARFDSETNVALASLEYAMEAALWKVRYPDLVQLGTADSWKLARLAFAVGRGGSYQLADRARAAGYLSSGNVYGGIAKHVAAAGAPQLGSQSPSKVVARVASIPEQWAIGEAVDGSGMGPPTLIPNPPAGPYTIPANVRPLFAKPIPGIFLVVGGALAFLYYLMRR